MSEPSLPREVQREIVDSDRRFNERIMQVKDAKERMRLRRLWLQVQKDLDAVEKLRGLKATEQTQP